MLYNNTGNSFILSAFYVSLFIPLSAVKYDSTGTPDSSIL